MRFESRRSTSTASKVFSPHCSRTIAPRRVVRKRTSWRNISSIGICWSPARLGGQSSASCGEKKRARSTGRRTVRAPIWTPKPVKLCRSEGVLGERRAQGFERRLDGQSLPACLVPRAVPHNVLGIFQLIAGEDGDDVGVQVDFPGAHELSDARHGRRRSRLRAYAVFGEQGLSLENLFV